MSYSPVILNKGWLWFVYFDPVKNKNSINFIIFA